MQLNTRFLLGLLWLAVCFVVFVPLSLHEIRRLWKHHNLVFIRGRKPKQTFLVYGLILFNNCVSVVIPLAIELLWKSKRHNVLYAIPMSNVIAIVCLDILRFWNILYGVKHKEAESKELWVHEFTDETESFWIKYSSFLAHSSLPFSVTCITIAALGTTVTMIAWYQSLTYAGIALISILSVDVICLLIIRYNIPVVYDMIGLRKQLTMQSILLLPLILAYPSVFLLMASPRLQLQMFLILPSCALFGQLFLGTTWIMSLQYRDIVLHRTKSHQVSHSIQKSTSMGSPMSGKNGFFEVISDRQGFEALMTHCMNEHSAENLLYLVEAVQFKKTMTEIYPAMTHFVNIPELPKSLPTSRLIREYPTIPLRYMALFEKYIDSGEYVPSGLEVNISWNTRMLNRAVYTAVARAIGIQLEVEYDITGPDLSPSPSPTPPALQLHVQISDPPRNAVMDRKPVPSESTQPTEEFVEIDHKLEDTTVAGSRITDVDIPPVASPDGVVRSETLKDHKTPHTKMSPQTQKQLMASPQTMTKLTTLQSAVSINRTVRSQRTLKRSASLVFFGASRVKPAQKAMGQFLMSGKHAAEELTEEQLMKIVEGLDVSLTEVLDNLRDTFLRYKRTEEHEKWCNRGPSLHLHQSHHNSQQQ